MRSAFTAAQVRSAEQALPDELANGTLMRRAAFAVAVQSARLVDKVYGASAVLLVGTGNNGGDALFAGAELARQGMRVTALLLDPGEVHAGGLAALLAAGGQVGKPDSIATADVVLDGLYGLGGRAGLHGDAADWANAARSRTTVALDIPSGVVADTGEAGQIAVRADVTVTFGGLKPGLLCGAGAALAGQIRIADIGLSDILGRSDISVLEIADVAAALPQPGADSDKYTRGVVGVVAGSSQYPGAGVLCTGSALHGGSGMVRYLGTAGEQIKARYPEVIVHPDTVGPDQVQVQAWTVGPGMGTDDPAARLLAGVLGTDQPTIVDADGITLLAQAKHLVQGRGAPTVVTPHDREFARLAGEPGPDRIGAARRLAVDLGITVLLKGNATVVADPDGAVWLNTTGTPWLATAGSGDVLSGLIGSLLAAGLAPGLAAAVGAHVHGLAGQLAARGGPPSAADLLESVRPALALVRGGRE
jgi:hydroxyethylthiazole kinase-like uncharacterized protein yjeF